MREIKFRAWDKRTRLMFLVREMFWLVGGLQVDDGATTQRGFAPKDFAIMQYTGLKDKNGVEIYEGDILDRLDKILCVVTFEDGKFGWNIRYKNPELNQRQDYFGRNYANQNRASELEIIGNIYENKELLEEK